MKKSRLFCTLALLTAGCIHDLQNPSDPAADNYSTFSRAMLRTITTGDIKAGEPVRFIGGVSSEPVQRANLVASLKWDFDGDGNVDTVTVSPDTLTYIYKQSGTYRCILTCTDRARYTDTATVSMTIHPPAWGLNITILVRFGDTLHLRVNSADPITATTSRGETVTVIPHAQGDSISVVTMTGDTIGVPIINADTIALPGFRIETIKPPAGPVYLPRFPSIAGFPSDTGSDCAFFAADSALMHTNLRFYDIMWEQTKADGLEALDFVEKLLADIAGYSIITLAGNSYSYTFSNGLYKFTSGTFQIGCAFHYGAGMENHTENDTVRSDLFSLASYIGSLKATLNPPFYSFTRGPLYDLITGDVTIDRSLNVSFAVNFSRLKISFLRKAVTAAPSVPMYIVNDSLRLRITHTSYARMAPAPVLGFGERYRNDSIMIDHHGTSMETQPAPLEVMFRSDTAWKKATYLFSIKQIVDSQLTAYGKRDNIRKLAGTYAATATLGFDGYDHSVYFGGTYSSVADDSSWFYCDREKSNQFGTLFFGIVADSVGTFTSDKFDYGFNYVPLRASLATIRTLFP